MGQFDEHCDLIEEAQFVAEVYEIAFGDDAINRGFTKEEVLAVLKDYSEKAWMYEELNK